MTVLMLLIWMHMQNTILVYQPRDCFYPLTLIWIHSSLELQGYNSRSGMPILEMPFYQLLPPPQEAS